MDLTFLNPADWLGSLTGVVIALILYILTWFGLWGLWTAIVLSKAGFDDESFSFLYVLLNLTFWLAPLAYFLETSGIFSSTYREAIAVGYALISVGSLWLGLVLTAVIPWPLRKAQKPKGKKLHINAES